MQITLQIASANGPEAERYKMKTLKKEEQRR